MGFVCFKDLVKENNVSNEEIMTGWKKFCNENNFLSSSVDYLPHHRADSIFYALYYLCELGGWEYNCFENFDYKDELLKIIDEIKESTPEDKPLSYNIDKLRKIIEEAKTPKEALENAKKEYKMAPIIIHQAFSKELIIQETKKAMIKLQMEIEKSIFGEVVISKDEALKNLELLDTDKMLKDYAVQEFRLLVGATKDFLSQIDKPNKIYKPNKIKNEYID